MDKEKVGRLEVIPHIFKKTKHILNYLLEEGLQWHCLQKLCFFVCLTKYTNHPASFFLLYINQCQVRLKTLPHPPSMYYLQLKKKISTFKVSLCFILPSLRNSRKSWTHFCRLLHRPDFYFICTSICIIIRSLGTFSVKEWRLQLEPLIPPESRCGLSLLGGNASPTPFVRFLHLVNPKAPHGAVGSESQRNLWMAWRSGLNLCPGSFEPGENRTGKCFECACE